jgi:hypothetical protein
MLPRILIGLAMLISIGLFFLTHQLAGERRGIVRVQVVLDKQEDYTSKGIRFDLLRTSVTDLLDSLSRIDVLSPTRQVVRVVEDEQREAFLRSAIEQRGFVLSRICTQSLYSVQRTRSAYIDHIVSQPAFSDMLDAVRLVIGPLTALPVLVNAPSIWPERLNREQQLYSPDRDIFGDEVTGERPDAHSFQLYSAWKKALDDYTRLYYRDLIQRSILTAAVYRNLSIASAETDTLGQATMAPVAYGTYWLAGHDPADVMALARIHRLQMIQRLHPTLTHLPLILTWNRSIQVDQADQQITITQTDAVPLP